jgi:hypothetical protein
MLSQTCQNIFYNNRMRGVLLPPRSRNRSARPTALLDAWLAEKPRFVFEMASLTVHSHTIRRLNPTSAYLPRMQSQSISPKA